MKHIIRYTTFVAAALLALACNGDQPSQKPKGMPLILDVAGTRAANYSPQEYFAVSPEATVTMGQVTGTYTYADGKLSPNSAQADDFRFPIDGSGVDIAVSWPVGYVAPRTDQSTKANFLLSDALQDVMTAVAPTTSAVPVYFSHTNTLVEFVGSDSTIQITELTLDQYEAWCDPALGTAQLLLDPAAAAGIITSGATVNAVILTGGIPQPVTFTLGSVPAAGDYKPGSSHKITLTL